MKNAIEKAKILSQALPYIQKYNNKIVVIKYDMKYKYICQQSSIFKCFMV